MELQQQYADLESRLTSREAELSEMIASLQLKLEDSHPQIQRYNFKVSDEKVKQDFSSLQFKIQQFVDKYARPVHNVTDQQLDVVWPNWSPELRSFLGSPLLCHLVFDGYVWEHLLRRIFTRWSKIWVGDLGRPLEKVLRIAEGMHTSLCSSLYSSANILWQGKLKMLDLTAIHTLIINIGAPTRAASSIT